MKHQPPIVAWIGRFSTHDGYGSAARSHVTALRSVDAAIVAIDLASLRFVGDLPDGLVEVNRREGALKISSVDPQRKIVAIVHETPDLYPRVQVTGMARAIGYSYPETASLPPGWAALMSSMDRIWTSSVFAADVFRNGGVPSWMTDVVQHPVDPLALDVAAGRDRARRRWPERTVFMSVVTDVSAQRLDLNLLLEAFSMAFDPDDDVAIVLKVSEDGAESLRHTLARVMATMPARSSGRWPTIYVVGEDLTREQLLRLQASVDCYVSCERGSGWDLRAMDSLTIGVPVVASGLGASTALLERDDCYVVEPSTRMVECDASLDDAHPLYSGQYWPYVDPAAFALALRAAHDDPADREERGRKATARIREAHDEGTVGREVESAASPASEVDYRSNAPAAVTISARGGWAVRTCSTMAANPKLNEAVLMGLLTDERFLSPRDPREFVRVYKAASQYASEYRAALSNSELRTQLAQPMAVPMRRPIAKATALLGLRREVLRSSRRFGDPEDLAELVEVVRDYRHGLDGRPSRFSAEQAGAARRAVWGRFGPFRSPDADLQRLRDLKNRHFGERVFVLGNGPSLVKCDLSKLAGESTFGVNKIFMLYDQLEWRPTYYTLLDWKMGAGVRAHVEALRDSVKFFPERYRGVLPSGPDVFWYWPRPVGAHVDDQFEPNIDRGIPSRATVLVTAIQQAFHLGFRDIILVGVDAEYTIPSTVKQSGPDVFGTGVRLHLESTADDDPNHFTPAYFGEGAKWHDPNVADMRRLFRLMRKGVERHGGRLLNASVGGSLDEVERVDYDALFA